MPSTSPAIEDYLKTVYAHTEWQPDPITPKVLADRLGVAPSSVTEMVKKMAAAGLVSHVPYGAVRLTDAGLARALAVVRRHRLIETWLVREMGYGWDEVHDEAEVLEHAISDRLLEAIDARLGRPVRDPHGDAIPAADGTLGERAVGAAARCAARALGRGHPHQRPRPRRAAPADELGIGPGTVLTVTDVSSAGASPSRRSGAAHRLPAEAALAIWVAA